jgi:hypothetical protein
MDAIVLESVSKVFFSLTLMAFSLWLFSFTLRQARQQGTLSFY